mmetsp:Transcript_43643/g.98470  ORF Transcript_43643/g.98470 Transcript_43643/m.98470 type:complete len:249 (-) Transcript_43643:371-1117(-)
MSEDRRRALIGVVHLDSDDQSIQKDQGDKGKLEGRGGGQPARPAAEAVFETDEIGRHVAARAAPVGRCERLLLLEILLLVDCKTHGLVPRLERIGAGEQGAGRGSEQGRARLAAISDPGAHHELLRGALVPVHAPPPVLQPPVGGLQSGEILCVRGPQVAQHVLEVQPHLVLQHLQHGHGLLGEGRLRGLRGICRRSILHDLSPVRRGGTRRFQEERLPWQRGLSRRVQQLRGDLADGLGRRSNGRQR